MPEPTSMAEAIGEVDVPLDPFADPASPEPPPSTARTQPATTAETAEQRSRRCPFWKHCTCDHTECRDGWLDEDEPDPTPMDAHHVRSRRCRFCNDAREMASELRAMRGKRR